MRGSVVCQHPGHQNVSWSSFTSLNNFQCFTISTIRRCCCEHREHGSGWNWLMTLAEKTCFLISIVIMLHFFDEWLTFLLEDVLSSLKEAAAGSSYPTKSSIIVFLNISGLSLCCYQSCQQDALWGEMEPPTQQSSTCKMPSKRQIHKRTTRNETIVFKKNNYISRN